MGLQRFFKEQRIDPAKYCEVLDVRPGETLSFRRSGEAGFFAVDKGHVSLNLSAFDPPRVLRICGPGDLVGFGSWFMPVTLSDYTIRCLDRGKLSFMSRSNFEQLRKTHPATSDFMIESLCKILALKDERISALETHSVTQRAAALLLSLSKKFGIEESQGYLLIDVAIDRKTMAALAATSVESLSRAITHLEESGLIARRRRKILVKNQKRLAKQAGLDGGSRS